MPASLKLRDRLEPLARVRGVGLGLAPGLLLERRDREVDADVGDLGERLEELQVAERQRRLGQDRGRRLGSRSASSIGGISS